MTALTHHTAVSRLFIAAPPALVFEVFTHYETYRWLPGVRATALIHPGRGNPVWGTGAVREIDLGVMAVHEEVTAVQYPHFWDYRFVSWPLPLRHLGGRMAFEPVPGGTRMVWTSTVEGQGLMVRALPFAMWLSGLGLKGLSWQMRRLVLQRQARERNEALQRGRWG